MLSDLYLPSGKCQHNGRIRDSENLPAGLGTAGTLICYETSGCPSQIRTLERYEDLNVPPKLWSNVIKLAVFANDRHTPNCRKMISTYNGFLLLCIYKNMPQKGFYSLLPFSIECQSFITFGAYNTILLEIHDALSSQEHHDLLFLPLDSSAAFFLNFACWFLDRYAFVKCLWLLRVEQHCLYSGYQLKTKCTTLCSIILYKCAVQLEFWIGKKPLCPKYLNSIELG